MIYRTVCLLVAGRSWKLQTVFSDLLSLAAHFGGFLQLKYAVEMRVAQPPIAK